MVELANGRIKVIGGNGSNSTAEAVQLTEKMSHFGVDGFLNVTPYYNKPSVEGLIAIVQLALTPQINRRFYIMCPVRPH